MIRYEVTLYWSDEDQAFIADQTRSRTLMQPRPGGEGDHHGMSRPRRGSAAHLWLLVIGALLGNGCSAPSPHAGADSGRVPGGAARARRIGPRPV